MCVAFIGHNIFYIERHKYDMLRHDSLQYGAGGYTANEPESKWKITS